MTEAAFHMIKNMVKSDEADNRILMFSLGAFIIYIILLLLNVSPLLRAISAFPAIYLVPGLLLCLLVCRRTEEFNNLKLLIVESFFVSTIINVLIVSFFVLLAIPLHNNFFIIFYIIFILFLALANFLAHKSIRIRFPKYDYAAVCIVLIGFMIATAVFSTLPRYFTHDETLYIADVRDIILKGEISSWSLSTSSEPLSLLSGRMFWTLLEASFICSTGLAPYQIGLLSCIFLSMIALASSLLIPSNFKDKETLQIALVALTLSNPLLIEFSGFILNDLAISFYFLFGIALFIESFKINDNGNPSIERRKLILSFLSVLTALLIKTNVLILLPMYIILIFFMVKYKIFRIKKYKTIFYTLIIAPLVYEFAFDIPYALVTRFKLGSDEVRYAIRAFTSPIISIGSPFQTIYRWRNIFIHDYDMADFLNYLYRLLSPEALGLIFAGIGFGLPAVLLLKKIRNDINMKLLTFLVSLSLALLYLIFLSSKNIEDVNRYSLFIYPLITTISLSAFYVAFSEANSKILSAIIVPSVLLQIINYLLLRHSNFLGVYIGYGLPPINWTYISLATQLIIYLIIVITRIKNTNSNKLHNIFKVTPLKILFLLFLVSILSSNIYFSYFFLTNSTYLQNTSLKNLNKPLNRSSQNFILTNSYVYLRDYIDNNLYLNNFIFPPPTTREELEDFLSRGFNESTIIVTTDPRINGYEYNNSLLQSINWEDYPYIKQIYQENTQNERTTIYQSEGSIKLHKNKSEIMIQNAKVEVENSVDILKINISSPKSTNLLIIVGTVRFSKIFNVKINYGVNILEYPFNKTLPNGDGYGSYIANKCNIIVVEDNGNIIYDETIVGFQLKNAWLAIYIAILLTIIILYFALTSKSSLPF